jgi:sigma-E factor negative regulatory protein RseB
VDSATALLLRRETFDDAGRLIRSSAFAMVSVGDLGVERAPAALTYDGLDPQAVADLRDDGWDVPESLAEGLDLYDARVRTHDGKPVLHLSYSDGLSTLSLFAQRGRLGATRLAGFTRQKVGEGAVWVRSSSPERVVWGGGGRVYTLLSDAPAKTVRAAVTVLPHEKAPRSGLLARLGRGLSRLASWINPFD